MKMVSLSGSIFRLLVLVGALLASATAAHAADTADEAAIRRLNDDYLRSYLQCDVARYRELLADDFRCVLSDGRIIGRDEFLQNAAVPPDVKDFRADEAFVRVIGDTALVNGSRALPARAAAGEKILILP